MLGLSELKQTKVYQEALEEGKQQNKLETIPRMVEFGLSSDAMSNDKPLRVYAQLLDLPLEVVQQAVQQTDG